ncbi:GNAT family N-acetyltransferase [Halomonas maura]|uniref:GNAT family N-acetyltransferase n=1 Tax=Halomonas maura TaxID=117606 RepID=UPI0025B517FE|nr:GNAT family N-acetyltransferase [Halomonas maura]MDN3556955.1 GNAT family N-acetyltransferase [Halomonas maura]
MAYLSKSLVPGVGIRRAERGDAIEIARLFLISSDGLAAYIWGDQADAGQSLEEIGAGRYARQGVAFSYQNCLLATRDQEILGMIHAFPMPERAPGDVETDPVLRPYAELEDPGSLYISSLAVHAPYRRHGVGEGLLEGAHALALRRALPRLSLICFERNATARAFYARRGFRVVDRRRIVPHPALHCRDGDALLMVCPAGARAAASRTARPDGDAHYGGLRS